MTSFCLQKEINFVDYSQSKKKEFLMQLLNLNIFEDLLSISKDRLKEKTILFNNTSNEINKINYAQTKEKLEKVKKEKTILLKNQSSLQKIIEKNNEEINKFNKKIIIIKKPKEFNRFDSIKTEINKLKSENQLKIKAIYLLENQFNEKNNKLNSMTKLVNEINFIELSKKNDNFCLEKNEKIQQIKIEIKNLQNQKTPTKNFENNLIFYEQKFDKVINELNCLNEKLIEFKNEKSVQESKIVEINNREEIENKFKQFIEMKTNLEIEKKEVEELKRKISEMNIKLNILDKHKYDPNCEFCVNNQFVKDALDTKKKLNIEKNNLKKLEKSLKIHGDNFENIKKIDEEFKLLNILIINNKKFKQIIEAIDNKINILYKDIELKQKEIDKFENILIEYKESISNINLNQEINGKIDLFEKNLNQVQNESFVEYNIYQEKKKEYNYLNNELKDINIKLNNLKTELNNIQIDLKNKEEIIIKINEYIKIKKINEDILDHINKIILNNNKTKLELNQINDKNIELTKQICLLENDMTNHEKYSIILNNYEKDIKILKLYNKILDKNGLPCKLFDNIIPEIQQKVNQILLSLTDFSIEIKLDDKNLINIYKNFDKYQHEIDLCSGYEKFIIGLAFRITLTKISNLHSFNFLIIDEGFNCMDSDNLNNLDSLFLYLKENFDFIIIISHLQSLKSVCDNILNIKINKQGFSNIYHE